MLKEFKINKLFALFIVLLITASQALLAQRQDTTFQCSYHLGEEAELNIDISHAELMISPSIDDSIRIHSSISLLPNNIATPFNGIITTAQQIDSTKIQVNLLISSEIQPHNQLKAFCHISLPKQVNINLNGRYTQIDLSSPFGQLELETEYCTIRAVALDPNKCHYISGSYSELFIGQINTKLKLEGINMKLESQSVNHLQSNLKFSTINIKKLKSLNAISYSDKYILHKVDSATIKGDYSSMLLEELSSFFQSDLSYGTLIIKNISPTFSEINLAHEYVTSQLYYAENNSFSINADMRYCDLLSPDITYKKIASPSGTLYKGYYGRKTNNASRFSIISSFGDITLKHK